MKKVVLALVMCAAMAASCEEMVKIGGKGRLAVVDTYGAPQEAVQRAARKLENLLLITVSAEKGTWSFANAQSAFDAAKATAAVFIVKDPALPMSLVAMESKWGVVNADGLDEKGVEKELLRVATVVLGGASSKYTASSMRPVFSKEGLAKAGDVVTFDSLMAMFTYLPEMGFKQHELVPKEDADK